MPQDGPQAPGTQMDAVAAIEGEVRELVRRRGLDPAADVAAVRRLVEEGVADYEDRALTRTLVPLAAQPATVRRVLDAVAGFGQLQPFLDDPTVEELWINDPGRVFVARAGRS